MQEAEELGRIQYDTKGKGKESKEKGQRERDSQCWKPVRHTYPKQELKQVSTAPTVQEKPKDRLRGLFVRRKRRKNRGRGKKGTNY